MKRLIALILGLAFLAPAAVVQAGELRVGDRAPKLTIAKWLKGRKIDIAPSGSKSTDGKVYVIDFWATWCLPCVESIPHLTELQHRFADRGVTVVGVTSEDDNNSLKMVKAFVKRWGDKMDYTVAFDEKEKTQDAYMKASGQMGIPTAFVIDRSGRLAWIGSPFDGLDYVVEEVVAGNYDIEIAKKVAVFEKRIFDAYMLSNWPAIVDNANEWLALRPTDYRAQMLLLRVHSPSALNQPGEVTRIAEKLINAHWDQGWALVDIAWTLAQKDDEHGFNVLALKAIQRARELAPNDAEAKIVYFHVLASMGRDSESLEFARRSLATMEGDGLALSRFAEVLSAPGRNDVFKDLALQAIDLAIAAEPDEARYLRAKFDILLRCKRDFKQAEVTGRYLIEKAGDDVGLLNEFAWNLLVDPVIKGRFNELALAAAERCYGVSGGSNWQYVDTYAIALFENGRREEAIRFQKKAIELLGEEGPLMTEMRDRLKRFESAGD